MHRHRVLRLMRESWRLNKAALYEAVPAGMQLQVFLIFTHTELPEFITVQDAVVKGMERFCNDFKAVNA